jgi:hypothetical protein
MLKTNQAAVDLLADNANLKKDQLIMIYKGFFIAKLIIGRSFHGV